MAAFPLSASASPPASWMPGAAARHRLEIVRDEAGFDALQPHWDPLVSQMAVITPFLRWDWVRRWWQHFGTGRKLAIGVLRDEAGTPLAIAPCILTRGRPPFRSWLWHLTWLSGLGSVQGERMDLIIPAGREAQLAPQLLRLLDQLAAEWDVVSLPAIPDQSPNLPALRDALDRTGSGWELASTPAVRHTAIPADWKSYEAARSSRWRRNLRHRWTAFTEKHAGRRGISGIDLPHAEALDHLARLHLLHWPRGVSNYLRHHAWPFHRALALHWLQEGRALLTFLIADEKVVAATFGLIERGAFSLFQQGWDPAYKALSIGNLAVHWSLESAARLRLHTYDTLTGDSRYKAEWCPQLTHNLDLETFHPEVLPAHLFRALRHLRRLLTHSTADAPAPDDDG